MDLADDSTVRVQRDTGKGREAGWSLVGGEGRCAVCLKDDAQCVINMVAVEKWREEVKEGKRFHRNPTGTNCERCTKKKRKCELPATARMRRAMEGVSPAKPRGSQASGYAPSASSGGRRGQVLEGVVLPPRKRQRVTGEETEADSPLVEVLRSMDRNLRGVWTTLEDMSRIMSKTYSSTLRQEDCLRRISEALLARREGLSTGPPESVGTPGIEASGTGVSGGSSDMAGGLFEGDEGEEGAEEEGDEESEKRMG